MVKHYIRAFHSQRRMVKLFSVSYFEGFFYHWIDVVLFHRCFTLGIFKPSEVNKERRRLYEDE